MDYFYNHNSYYRAIGLDVGDSFAFVLFVGKFITNLNEWKKQFSIPGSFITDHNGCMISPEDLEMIITVRSCKRSRSLISDSTFIGGHGLVHLKTGTVGSMYARYGFNSAYKYKCIANEGCWDLCVRM